MCVFGWTFSFSHILLLIGGESCLDYLCNQTKTRIEIYRSFTKTFLLRRLIRSKRNWTESDAEKVRCQRHWTFYVIKVHSTQRLMLNLTLDWHWVNICWIINIQYTLKLSNGLIIAWQKTRKKVADGSFTTTIAKEILTKVKWKEKAKKKSRNQRSNEIESEPGQYVCCRLSNVPLTN